MNAPVVSGSNQQDQLPHNQIPQGPSEEYPQRQYESAARTYAQQPGQVKEDPGKVLGIISLVATLSTFLGFNFLGPIAGIIAGYFARKNSRQAGFGDNEMGKWGFILGIVFVSLAVLGGLIGLSIGAISGLWGLYAGW